jgi:hypothetical protein
MGEMTRSGGTSARRVGRTGGAFESATTLDRCGGVAGASRAAVARGVRPKPPKGAGVRSPTPTPLAQSLHRSMPSKSVASSQVRSGRRAHARRPRTTLARRFEARNPPAARATPSAARTCLLPVMHLACLKKLMHRVASQWERDGRRSESSQERHRVQ